MQAAVQRQPQAHRRRPKSERRLGWEQGNRTPSKTKPTHSQAGSFATLTAGGQDAKGGAQAISVAHPVVHNILRSDTWEQNPIPGSENQCMGMKTRG